MLTFGIIGTSDISHHFIEAAHLSKHYQLKAIFSRKMATARFFAHSYTQVQLYTDWQEFLASSLDVVYVASPNSLHFEQTKDILQAGKHAIVEKPMVSTPQELKELRQIAKQHQVFLFEAARNFQEAAFKTIKTFLQDKHILGAQLHFAKYSSKMPELLAGNTPNIFSADFSGGALMDLGIYPIYIALGLFGQPKSARYSAQQLPSSIDLNGCGQLIYDEFIVGISAGKNITNLTNNEIYTSQGTLSLNACHAIQQATFISHDGKKQIIPLTPAPHPMLEEAQNFAQAILQQDTSKVDTWLDLAEAVHQTLYTMRQDANILFKADTHEI